MQQRSEDPPVPAPDGARVKNRLLAVRERSPTYAALARAYERHGRMRINVLIGWSIISIISFTAVVLTHIHFTAPAVTALPGSGADAAENFLRSLLGLFVLLVLLISAATYLVLYYGVVRPVEDFRDRLNDRMIETGREASMEIASLASGSQKRTTQLEAALADNELMRAEQRELTQAHDSLSLLFKSTIETVTDRLILVDAAGKVVEISPLTGEMIGLHRSRVVGEEFEKIINLYDPHKDNPLEYRLKGLVGQVLESASAIPKITPALLLTPHGHQEKILLSVAAILDRQAQAVGASIRLENDSTIPGEKPGAQKTRGRNDPITGLPGRYPFNSRLKELIEVARVRGATHTLLLLGLDNMSSIHDTFGQRAGEELLWNAAQMIQAEAGAGVNCYRVTADFIAMLFPFSERAAMETLGRRICDSIAGRVFGWREARYEATVSGGMVEIGPDSEGVEGVMEHANTAQLHARSQGGNRVHRYDPDEKSVTRRRSDQEWLNWLLPRLDNGGLHLISQSILPLAAADTRLPMFEVFMRVEDEDGVWVSPGAFMPAAARHQKCSQVDLAVVKAVLAELDRNPAILDKHLCASINLSGCALEEPDFAGNLVQLIRLSGVPGNRLCFEIDEPYVMSHRSVFTRFSESVKSCGVKLALDHYKAAGGLDSLIDIPISYVKIHESMTRRLAGDLSDPASRLSLSWINEICHARRIGTIAAGIEDANALEALKAGGTDFGQGVFLNKLGPLMV